MSNLQMVDFAVNDNRSVAAMLRGKGDGREKVFQKFQGKHEALMSQEELQTAFTKAVRYGKIGNRDIVINKVKKSLLTTLSSLAVIP